MYCLDYPNNHNFHFLYSLALSRGRVCQAGSAVKDELVDFAMN